MSQHMTFDPFEGAMKVGAEEDSMETRTSELISVSKLGDIDRSWVSVHDRPVSL